MERKTPSYTIYLLTVWFDETGDATDPLQWRFRLENPKTQERQGYIGLEALMAGLVGMVVRSMDSSGAPDEDELDS